MRTFLAVLFNFVTVGSVVAQICPGIGIYSSDSLELNKSNLRSPASIKSSGEKIKIPIVVHVIHDGIPNPNIFSPNLYEDNIPEEDILRQVKVLNEDFNRLNEDRSQTLNIFNSVAADVGVEFVLAETDPDGNPTNGIDRVFYPGLAHTGLIVNQEIENVIKPLTIWDPKRYFNIWTIRFVETSNFLALLGYAQFPDSSGLAGMPCDNNAQSASTDGVVVNPIVFGVAPENDFFNNANRTLTHEIGHSFGLRHSWGDGACGADDFVEDTPPADGPSSGCQQERVSCGNLVQVQNYMDYTNGSCQNLFTLGQKERMVHVLNTCPRRRELATSDAINRGITRISEKVQTQPVLFPNPSTKPYVHFNNQNDQPIPYLVKNIQGQTVLQGHSTGSINFGNRKGLFFVQLNHGQTQKVVLN